MGGGCDSVKTNQHEDSPPDFSLQSIPRYASAGAKGNRTLSTPSAPGYATCVVSTLLPADSTQNYRYNTYKVKLPGSNKNSEKIWKDFTYVSPAAPDYATQVSGTGGIIRMARCRIPKSDPLITWLQKKFTDYGPGSWMAARGHVSKPGKNQGLNTQSSAFVEYHCDVYLVQTTCVQQNGRIIPGTCASYVIGCTSGHYIDNGTPGGNGGPSADGCEPCAQPGTGDQVPCSSSNGISSGSDKLSGIGPPTGCATDPPPPPPTDPCDYENPPAYCTMPDPCDQTDSLESDSDFKAKLNRLLNDANNEDVENGYVMTKQDDGSYSFSYFEGGQHQAGANVDHPIDGVIHSHPAGNLSIFSPQDIRNIYNLYKAGSINDIHSYTSGVVTYKGSTYLLKISDLAKFLDFGDNYLNSQSLFNGFNRIFDEYGYHINPSNTVNTNETRFLQMLNQLDTGLKLFKGDTDSFNSWQAKTVDSNNEEINSDCN